LHELEVLAQPVVHLPEVLAEQLALPGERLAQLCAEGVELLLEEDERAVVAALPDGSTHLPSEQDDRTRDHQ